MWKYANPGNYKLLNHHEGLSYVNLLSTTKAPITGCCYTNKTKEDYPISLPNNTKELWFRIDVYIKDEINIVFCDHNKSKKVTLNLTPNSFHLDADYRAYSYELSKFADMQKVSEELRDFNEKVITITLHIKSAKINEGSPLNTTSGIVELRINNKLVSSFTNLAILNGEDIYLSTISSEEGRSYFSNIIVSDEKVQSREKCAILPVSSIISDGWTETDTNNGEVNYITDNINKDIVYILDTDAIKTQLGEDVIISSISLQAFNMSSDDENIVNSIERIIKNGDVSYHIDTSYINSNNSTMSRAITTNPSTSSNWTLADLETTQFILRTAKQTWL